MKTNWGKRVTAFIAVLTLLITSQVSMYFVRGEGENSVFKQVELFDKNGKNLNGETVSVSEKMSLVYYFDIPKQQDELTPPEPPVTEETLPPVEGEGETPPTVEDGTTTPETPPTTEDGTIPPETPPTTEDGTTLPEIPPDSDSSNDSTSTPPDSDSSNDTSTPPDSDSSNDTSTPPDSDSSNDTSTLPDSDSSNDSTSTPADSDSSNDTTSTPSDSDSSNDTTSTPSDSNSSNTTDSNTIAKILRMGSPVTVYGEDIAPVLEYTTDVPSIFDLSGAADFELTSDDGAVIGNGVVDSTNNKITLFVTTSDGAKGKFSVDVTFNSEVATQQDNQKMRLNNKIVSEPMNKKINFNIGKGIQTIEIKLLPTVTNTVLASPKDFDFFTGVEVLTEKYQSLPEELGIGETVQVKYSYNIKTDDIEPNIPYTFQVPDELKIKDVDTLKFTIDAITNDGTTIIAANGTVNAATNEASVVFTPEAKEAGCLNNNTPGYFYIKAGFKEDEIKNGGKVEIVFTLPGNAGSETETIVFTLKELEANVDLVKTGTQDLATSSIKWKITATPTIKNDFGDSNARKFKSFVITDTLPNNVAYDTSFEPTIKDANGDVLGGSWTKPTESSGGTLTYTFSQDYESPENAVYTIEFNTKFDLGAWSGADKVNFVNKVNATFEHYQFKMDTNTKIVTLDTTTAIQGKPVTEKQATVSITGGFLTKAGALASGGATIDWTLKINKNSFTIDNVIINDSITLKDKNGNVPTGLQIENVEIYKSDSNFNTKGDEILKTPTIDNTAGTIKVELGQISTPIIIKYTTTVDKSYTEDNAAAPFHNKAVITGGPGPGPGLSITKEADVKIGSRLLTKSGTYDKSNHTITWKVQANEQGVSMEASTLVDEIPEGLTLVTDSVNFTGAAGTTKTDNNTLEVKWDVLGDKISTITYKTTVDNPELWAFNTNTTKPFTNTATLTTTIGGVEKTYKTTANPEMNSKVIEKKNGTYNFNTKEITWEIVFNQNEMAMTDITIEDIIPVIDQTYVANSISYTNCTAKSPATFVAGSGANDGVLTIKIGDLQRGNNDGKTDGLDLPKITYKTKLTNEKLLEGNEAAILNNTAILTCAQMNGGSEDVTATAQIAKSVVEKDGAMATEPNGVKEAVLWEITMNRNHANITKGSELVDKLPDGLTLKSGSVKLYKLTLKPNGEVDESKNEEISIKEGSLSYNNATLRYKFLEDTTNAYRLTFKTYFENDATYTNTVGFEGFDSGEIISSKGVAAAWSGGGGATRPNQSNKITVTKVDENGAPIKGASFILGTDESTIKETDDNGNVVFDKLWQGDYIVTEISPATGYYYEAEAKDAVGKPTGYIKSKPVSISGSGINETVTFKNDRIKGNLQVTKIDADDNDKPLSNAEITISKISAPKGAVSNVVATVTTDSNGVALFENLDYGLYRVEETKAPDGYVIDSEPFEINIDLKSNVSNGSLDYVGETIKHTLVNSKINGHASLIKTDEATNEPLLGVEFTLIRNNDEGTKQTSLTDENATIKWNNLPRGSYAITETATIEGYVLNTDIIEFTVDENTHEILQNFTATNRKIVGNIRVLKLDKKSTQPLEGAEFSVTSISDSSKTYTATSDKNGIAYFEGLTYGDYILKETKAPNRYKADENSYTVSIEFDGVTEVRTITNLKRKSNSSSEEPETTNPSSPDTTDPETTTPDTTTPETETHETTDTDTTTPGTATPGTTTPETETPETPETTDTDTTTPENIPLEPPATFDPEAPGNTEKRVEEAMEETETVKKGDLDVVEDSETELVSPPSNGTVTVDRNGHWEYTPNTEFVGVDSFSVLVKNPDGTEEFIIVDVDVPLGNMILEDPAVAAVLPKTGEESRLPYYIGGALIMLLGVGLIKRCH